MLRRWFSKAKPESLVETSHMKSSPSVCPSVLSVLSVQALLSLFIDRFSKFFFCWFPMGVYLCPRQSDRPRHFLHFLSRGENHFLLYREVTERCVLRPYDRGVELFLFGEILHIVTGRRYATICKVGKPWSLLTKLRTGVKKYRTNVKCGDIPYI